MEIVLDGNLYLPIEEAAELLQTTKLRILMLLKSGSLHGQELAGEWYIERDSLIICRQNGSTAEVVAGCRRACATHDCGCAGKG